MYNSSTVSNVSVEVINKIALKKIKINELLFFLACSVEVIYSEFLSSFSINLLAFYHECRSLIGYTTHYLWVA